MLRLMLVGVGVAVALSGCGDDGSPAAESGTTSDPPATSGGSTSSTPGSTGQNPSSSGEPEGTTVTTSEVSTTGGSSSGTTGDDSYFCNGWDEDATQPFLEVYSDWQKKAPLESGGTWPISCGGQGSWMFAIFPALGGFTPAGDNVEFSVAIDVEGFSGPSGQFHLSPGYPYDVVCYPSGGTFDGGFAHDCIAILPPDEYLADLSVLDGAVATIDVALLGPDGSPVASVALTDVTLSAPEEEVSEDCFF